VGLLHRLSTALRRRERSEELACRTLVELVTEYLEGTLPAHERARVESHLAECEGCEAHLAQMRTTISLLGHIPAAAVSKETEAALAAAFADLRRGT
jgi:anti-sigma factor RsiW